MQTLIEIEKDYIVLKRGPLRELLKCQLLNMPDFPVLYIRCVNGTLSKELISAELQDFIKKLGTCVFYKAVYLLKSIEQ